MVDTALTFSEDIQELASWLSRIEDTPWEEVNNLFVPDGIEFIRYQRFYYSFLFPLSGATLKTLISPFPRSPYKQLLLRIYRYWIDEFLWIIIIFRYHN